MKKKSISDIIYLYNTDKEKFYRNINKKEKVLNNYKDTILSKNSINKYFNNFKNIETYSDFEGAIDDYFNIMEKILKKYVTKDSEYLNKNLDPLFLLFYLIYDEKKATKYINKTILIDVCIDIITFDFEKYKDDLLFYAILTKCENLNKVLDLFIDIISNKYLNNLNKYSYKFKKSMLMTPFLDFGCYTLLPYIDYMENLALYDDMTSNNAVKESRLQEAQLLDIIKFNLLLFLNNKLKKYKSYKNEYNIENNNKFISIFSEYVYFINESYDELISWIFKKTFINKNELKVIYKQHKNNIIKVKQQQELYNKNNILKVKQQDFYNKNITIYAEKLPISEHINYTLSFFGRGDTLGYTSLKYFYSLVELIGFIFSVQRTNYFYFIENRDSLEKCLYGDIIEVEYLDMKYTKNLENILINFYNENYNFFNQNMYLAIYIERKIKKIMMYKGIKFNKNDTLSPCIRNLFENLDINYMEYDTNKLIKFYESVLTNNYITPLNIRNSFGHISDLSESFNSRLCSDILIFLYYMLPK